MAKRLSAQKRFILEVFHFFLKNEMKNLDMSQNPLFSIEESIFEQIETIFTVGVEILKKGILQNLENKKGDHFVSQTFFKMIGELKDFKFLRNLNVNSLETIAYFKTDFFELFFGF